MKGSPKLSPIQAFVKREMHMILDEVYWQSRVPFLLLDLLKELTKTLEAVFGSHTGRVCFIRDVSNPTKHGAVLELWVGSNDKSTGKRHMGTIKMTISETGIELNGQHALAGAEQLNADFQTELEKEIVKIVTPYKPAEPVNRKSYLEEASFNFRTAKNYEKAQQK